MIRLSGLLLCWRLPNLPRRFRIPPVPTQIRRGRSVHHISEHYRSGGSQLSRWLEQQGVRQVSEGLHDDFAITAMMLTVDPTSVRLEQRRIAGRASINGVDIEPLDRTLEIGRRLIERRVDETVAAIRKTRESHSVQRTDDR